MKPLSFEKAIAQLEQIVKELESDGIELEKALKKYEEGVKLSRYCQQKLDETEQRITRLVAGPDGEIVETDFSPTAPDAPRGDE